MTSLPRRSVLLGASAAGLAACAPQTRQLEAQPSLWVPRIAPDREDFAIMPGGKIWYRATGSGNGLPVIVVHGGPAATSRAMFPFGALADERVVVFYDALGCGKSDAPDAPDHYSLDRARDDLEALQTKLSLPRVILIGHGTGGWTVLNHTLRNPTRVAGVVLCGSSPAASVQQASEAANLAALDGIDARAVREGLVGTPERMAALNAYFKAHMCRLPEPPDWLAPLEQETMNNRAHRAMVGSDRFQVQGSWATFDVRRRLREIAVPVMVTCGAHDINGPSVARAMAHGIPKPQLKIFAGLSHHAQIEDPALVTGTVRTFLRRLDPLT